MNKVNMQSLGLLILLTAAASAYSVDKYFYRCAPFLSDHGVVFNEPTYLCDSYDGRRYVVVKDNNLGDVTYNRVVIRDEGLTYPVTRTFPILGGIGGGGAGSAAQSSAGSLSGGIGGGILPFNVGGSISGAQSSAASHAGGGGLGFLG